MVTVFSKKTEKSGEQVKKKLNREDQKKALVKRCPECFINLPIDAKECFSCHTKVGGIDKYGRAKKRGAWVPYVGCIIAWGIFIAYIKWAFF